MARTVRNQKLDTRSARAKLPFKKGGYWTPISRGYALGYRKGPKGGVWLAKVVLQGTRRETVLGPADDVLDPDGATVFDFGTAQERARAWFQQLARAASGGNTPEPGPYSVRNALDDYLADYAGRGGKSVKETETRIKAFILPRFGEMDAATLTTKAIRDWHAELAAAPARLRTRVGAKQKHREAAIGPDGARPRRATANRTLTTLKAALNHAFNEGRLDNDRAWRRVKPFRAVDAAKVRYLTQEECRGLVKACAPSFRPLVEAALFTGCRYGELIALRLEDFDAVAATLTIRSSKGGRPRHVVLTDEGVHFFRSATMARGSGSLIFTRADGTAWAKSHQHRPMRDASERAKISPPVSFHILRHTYGSLLAQAGAAMQVIAANMGHADTRMTERHYAHLAPSHVADVIRAALPRLDLELPDSSVTIGGRRREKPRSTKPE